MDAVAEAIDTDGSVVLDVLVHDRGASRTAGEGPIACLVQPKYGKLAERRAAAIAGDDADEIRLYEGDITEPGLGLDGALRTWIRSRNCTTSRQCTTPASTLG